MYSIVLLNPRGVDVDTEDVQAVVDAIMQDDEIPCLAKVSKHQPHFAKEKGILLEAEDFADLDEAVELIFENIQFPSSLSDPWTLRYQATPKNTMT